MNEKKGLTIAAITMVSFSLLFFLSLSIGASGNRTSNWSASFPKNLVPPPGGSEIEPNDTPAQANPILVNESIVGQIPAAHPSDLDFFVLTAEVGQDYQVLLSEAPISADYRLRLGLYDGNENFMDEAETPGGDASLAWTASMTIYFFSVEAVEIAGVDAQYEISVTRSAVPPSPWDSCEINDSLSGSWSAWEAPGGPCSISAGVTVTDLNFVPYSGQPSPNTDYFSVTVQACRRYRLETPVSAGVDTTVYLYEPGMTDDMQYIASNDDAPDLGLGSRLEWTSTYNGAYLIKVENGEPLPHESDETYSLSVEDIAPTATVKPLAGVMLLGPRQGYTGTAYAFTAFITPTDAAPPISYTWEPAPDAGQATTIATYTWDTPGPYAVSVSAINCGATVSDTRSVSINAPPPPAMDDVYEEDDACVQASVILTDGSAQVHNFHDPGDADWTTFTTTQGISYVIEVRVPPTSTADADLSLYDDCGGTEQERDPTFSPDIRMIYQAPSDGSLFMKISNDNPNIYGTQATYHLSVRQIKPSLTGALVIVAGRLKENDDLQTNIHNVTNGIYRLARDNGCTPEQILYLATDPLLDADGDGTPDVDAPANRLALENAITDWVSNTIGPDQPFTLYLMDHGAYDTFYLDGTQGEVITPTALSGWLETLDATGIEVNVIIEACHSGSFIDQEATLSKVGRTVIASTGPLALAYATQDGALFSDALLNALGQATSLRTAFEDSQWAVGQVHPDQTPWLDANGDGMPNEVEDMQLATARAFACAAAAPDTEVLPPHIEQVDVTELESGAGVIWAQVLDDNDIQSVWAIVYPPSYDTPTTGEELEAEPPAVILRPVQDRENWYSGQHAGFNEGGEYRVIVYTRDVDELEARPQEHKVQVPWRVYLPVVLK